MATITEVLARSATRALGSGEGHIEQAPWLAGGVSIEEVTRREIRGRVPSSRGGSYAVTLTLRDDEESVWGICSCPMSGDCKHVHAMAIAFSEQAAELQKRFASDEPKLRRVLTQMPKDDLVETLLGIAADHADVSSLLLGLPGAITKRERMPTLKKLIRSADESVVRFRREHNYYYDWHLLNEFRLPAGLQEQMHSIIDSLSEEKDASGRLDEVVFLLERSEAGSVLLNEEIDPDGEPILYDTVEYARSLYIEALKALPADRAAEALFAWSEKRGHPRPDWYYPKIYYGYQRDGRGEMLLVRELLSNLTDSHWEWNGSQTRRNLVVDGPELLYRLRGLFREREPGLYKLMMRRLVENGGFRLRTDLAKR